MITQRPVHLHSHERGGTPARPARRDLLPAAPMAGTEEFARLLRCAALERGAGRVAPPEENDVSALYLMALMGVGFAILALLWDAVRSVGRKAPWESPSHALALVKTAERRQQELPYVGGERRARPSRFDTEHDQLAA